MAPNYSKSAVYNLECIDPLIKEIYVGSSTNIKRREYEHKSECNNENSKLQVYEFIRVNGGWVNWKLVIIEENFPCENASQLRAKERYYYDLLKPQLNMVRPLKTNQEHRDERKVYHQENREEILKNQGVYRTENREEIARGQSIYYRENIIEIARKRAIYEKENRVEIARKKAIYQTENRVEIARKRAIYDKENRVEIARKRVIRNQLNR